MYCKRGNPKPNGTPFPGNCDPSTGQYGGFLGLFFRRFLFWTLKGEQAVLEREKPAYLELFGLRIGIWDGLNYREGGK